MVLIRTEADIAKLKAGDPIEFDVDLSRFDSDPDGPVAMLDSDEWAEIQRLETAIEAAFSPPPALEIVVDFDTANKVGLTSNVDTVIAISGRVRENDNVKLKADKRKTYSLTKEDIDHVIVDGAEYKIPQSKETK